MTPNDMITWLRDQAARAPEDVLRRGMTQAADALAELEERRRFAAVQALLLADDKEQLEERVAQLEAQLAKDTNVFTNADRIRAMTDEELADMRVTYDPDADMYIADDRHGYYDFVSAMEAELEWLRQPAEEVTHVQK